MEKLSVDSTKHGGAGAFEVLPLPGDVYRPALLLMHGRNSNPDGPVVGVLRRRLNEDGYPTLSIANPTPHGGDEFSDYAKDWEGQRYVFKEALARIHTTIQVAAERRASRIVLVGFSMGARLMSYFLSQPAPAALPVSGFIGLSMGVNGPGALNAASTLPSVRIPVLDIYGEGDADVAKAAPQRKSAYEQGGGPAYRQICLHGSVPHNLAGAEETLLQSIRAWLPTV